jgi:murein DD-endopeptidase MepM/ murein hydrolase activator NlpD
MALPVFVAAFILAAPAEPRGSSDVAALQVALRARGVYAGAVDGIAGPQTRRAVRVFQRRAGLAPDGVVGPRTRRALGRYGRPQLGRRVLRAGRIGWDVSELQFLLAWHGFPSGTIDGAFGLRTRAAVMRFQRFARIGVDGVAGPATLGALRGPAPHPPLALAWPLGGPLTQRFGPRGARFHAGIDLAASYGVPVAAARRGRVAYAGWHNGGFGYLVAIAHGRGVRTLYAHLARTTVYVGQRVSTGSRIGFVGSTGASTGPHLHFEVRYRGAAADPLRVLR